MAWTARRGAAAAALLLEAEGLSCRRGGRCVFRGVSFALEPGDALVVTGENGSGKSTLLRVLAGLLPYAGGALRWQGRALDTGSEDWRNRVRYVGHLDACKPEWTVGETLAYWGAIYRGRLRDGDDPFGVLREVGEDRLARFLSAGQRRKLALTRLCLRGKPTGDSPGELPETQVWLLDEPTTALDRAGQDALVNLIERHQEGGGIAVIASHQGVPLDRRASLNLSAQEDDFAVAQSFAGAKPETIRGALAD